MRPGGSGMRRRIDRALTDLPEPLSPTMATVSPMLHGIGDPIDGAHEARPGAELGMESPHLQQWRHAVSPAVLGERSPPTDG